MHDTHLYVLCRYRGLAPQLSPRLARKASHLVRSAQVAEPSQETRPTSRSVSPEESIDADIQVRSLNYAGRKKPSSTAKVGVMLLNLGGPDSLEDVQPFLYNLFADPDIIRLPRTFQWLQPAIAKLISTLRAPKSQAAYKSIGGGSPLRSITQDQADALQEALVARGINSSVYVAMRYWHPYTEEAIEHLKQDNVDQLVVLPLYPQFSISTSGSSLRLLEGIFKSDKALAGLEHTVIPSWYSRRGYVTAMADLIEEQLQTFPDRESVRSHTACLSVRSLCYHMRALDVVHSAQLECLLSRQKHNIVCLTPVQGFPQASNGLSRVHHTDSGVNQ